MECFHYLQFLFQENNFLFELDLVDVYFSITFQLYEAGTLH